MGAVKLRYVHVFTDRTGKVRAYFRYRGKRWPLPHPDDPAFPQAYQSLMRTVAGEAAVIAGGEDSLGWLIRSYQASPEFKRLAERTRRDYAKVLSRIGTEHGTKSWRHLTRSRVMKHIRDPLADKPRTADLTVSVLSAVFAWAVRREIARENPCHGVERLHRVDEGRRAWTPAEIEAFCAGCTEDEFLLFALALYTGQRAADLAALTWFAYDGELLTVRQKKTRQPLRIVVHPVLKAVLDARPRSAGTILATADGQPLAPNTVSKRMGAAIARLGLEGCTLHGLRTTHAVLLAEGGASARQIMATTGHRTLAMVQHYTRDAEQLRMARETIARLPAVKRA